MFFVICLWLEAIFAFVSEIEGSVSIIVADISSLLEYGYGLIDYLTMEGNAGLLIGLFATSFATMRSPYNTQHTHAGCCSSRIPTLLGFWRGLGLGFGSTMSADKGKIHGGMRVQDALHLLRIVSVSIREDEDIVSATFI